MSPPWERTRSPWSKSCAAGSSGPRSDPPGRSAAASSPRAPQRLFEAAHVQGGDARAIGLEHVVHRAVGAAQMDVDVDLYPRPFEDRRARGGAEILVGEGLVEVVAADGVEALQPHVSALEHGVV